MVHRIHSRNVGYNNSSAKTLILNQPTLSATEGATALDINTTIEQNKTVEHQEQNQEQNTEPSLKNISIENATYLQSMENIPTEDESLKEKDEMPNFEVDSIELANPQLFSDDENINTTNQENGEYKRFNKDDSGDEQSDERS